MNLRVKQFLITAGVFLTLAATAPAGPIRISVSGATVVGGTTFNYPVNIDSSVTGLGVSSYQFELTYNTSTLTFVGINASGTMSSSWTNDGNEPTSGHVVVAGYGASNLSGTGTLIYLTFTAKVFTYQTSSSITFVSSLLNEGTPATTNVNSSITIQPPPAITVSPNTALLTKGDTQLFTVSGAVGPVTWSSTNPSTATITSGGLLSALLPGTTAVVAVDSVGTIDTSGTVEVRGLKLSVANASAYQGQDLDIPITTTDVTGLGILSGQLDITYNQNLWTPIDVIQAGTLIAAAGTPQFSVGTGKVSISFAGANVLSGSGTLFIVRLHATSSTYGGSTIAFQNVLFNENILANTQGGTATVNPLPTINVSPGGTQSLVKGDSLQFSASGGVGPYTWSVSDSQKAHISATGLLTVLRGGSAVVHTMDSNGATGSSGTVNLYDFRLIAPSWSQFVFSASDTAIDVPVSVTANDTGFIGFQFKITYSTSYELVLDSILTSGTLSSSWSVVPSFSAGSVTIAAATGGNAVTSAGTLLRLHFQIPGSAQRPSTTSISLSNVLFNEGAPIAFVTNGSLQIRSTNSKPVLQSRSPSAVDSLVIDLNHSFSVSVYDADSDPLTYVWSVDGATEKSGSSNSFDRIFSSLSVGTMVKVVFSDPFGAKDSTVWTFNVIPPNHPPTAPTTLTPKNSVNASPVSFAWSQSKDVDNDPLTYELAITGTKDTTLLALVDTTSSVVLPKGSYSWSVSVSDGQVTTLSDTSSFTVPNGAPSPFTLTQPTIDTVKTANTVLPIAWTNAADADNDPLTYLIHIAGPGLDTVITTTQDTTSITSGTFHPSSNYVITARVTDGIDTVAASNSKSIATASVLTYADQPDQGIPDAFNLRQNYPNPFNPSTTIQFDIPKVSFVTITVYDLLGNAVETLISASLPAGIHSVQWNASSYANGTYFYRLQAGQFVQTRKLVLLK